MEIDYINGIRTDKIFGMSKYQMEIRKRIHADLNMIEYDSLMYYFEKKFSDSSKPMSNKQTHSKIGSTDKIITHAKNTLKTIDKYRYISKVKASIKNGNIKHITSQELAYLLNDVDLERSVVTCYDLIPWVYNGERSKIWKENMRGLMKADLIITISKFSKREIMEYLKYPEDRIKIVYPGVDHSVYKINRDKKILNSLKIGDNDKVVLYVGSETPRMNVDVLLKAFALLKKNLPNVKFVKIGESQSYGARENIVKLINQLDIKDDVIFTGYVSEDDMPKWYNSADILVYPCDYAGFGLPPLEAMSCGTPVITSNTSSLPEVVGPEGLMVDPKDHRVMAEKLEHVLANDEISDELVSNGLERAKNFSWDEAARITMETYEGMI